MIDSVPTGFQPSNEASGFTPPEILINPFPDVFFPAIKGDPLCMPRI